MRQILPFAMLALLLSGCGLDATLTKQKAYKIASARAAELGGEVNLSRGAPMGLSANEWHVVAPDWDRTGIGDIVVFRKGGFEVMHRVVRKDGAVMVCKGDFNGDLEWVSRDNYIGTYLPGESVRFK